MTTLCYLCSLAPEPLWTNDEKERFWGVLEKYFRQLLCGEIPLPDSTLEPNYYQKNSSVHRTLFRGMICEDMWSGRYSRAISRFKAMKSYFDEQTSDKYSENEKLQEIKEIFMERPLKRRKLKSIQPNQLQRTGQTKWSLAKYLSSRSRKPTHG